MIIALLNINCLCFKMTIEPLIAISESIHLYLYDTYIIINTITHTYKPSIIFKEFI